jgi:spermidine synthase
LGRVGDLLLLLVAFLSGAILMALEIVGSRVLAPTFGGSIFVWGSLIGVFLAALSIGYYLGGAVADRAPRPWLLSLLLLASGCFVLLLPHYGSAICDQIGQRDFGPRANPLLACLVLFFAPGALMGITSPFVIRLTARAVEQVGHTAGVVYAVSTLGSIAGTLGSAFYLIPAYGTRKILYQLGLGLLGTGIVAAGAGAWRKRGRAAALLVALPLLGLAQPGVADEHILLERDSPYHRLFVADEGHYRYLRADNIWHTRMDLRDPHGRGLPYTDYADIAFLLNPKIRDVLVIGLGGGSIPKRLVRDYPQVRVDAVDIDPDVIKIAARYFDVHASARLSIYQADGRMFLKRTDRKYDLILLDAYYADTVPFFLATREFFRIARAHLRPGGVFCNNLIGQMTGPKSKFFRSVYRTMAAVFPQLYGFKVVESDASAFNFEVFAVTSDRSIGIGTIRSRAAQMQGRAIKDRLLLSRVANYIGPSVPAKDVPTLTDDYAPVDALIHLW